MPSPGHVSRRRSRVGLMPFSEIRRRYTPFSPSSPLFARVGRRISRSRRTCRGLIFTRRSGSFSLNNN